MGRSRRMPAAASSDAGRRLSLALVVFKVASQPIPATLSYRVNNVEHSRPEAVFGSGSRQSLPGVWVVCCFGIGFLLAWTVVTLFLDLIVATGFAVEISGKPVFLALFSIPFN